MAHRVLDLIQSSASSTRPPFAALHDPLGRTPDSYRAGDSSAVAKGVNVTAGNPVRVNVTLAIGALSDVVQVTSEQTLLQTDKADLNPVASAFRRKDYVGRTACASPYTTEL